MVYDVRSQWYSTFGPHFGSQEVVKYWKEQLACLAALDNLRLSTSVDRALDKIMVIVILFLKHEVPIVFETLF